MRHALEGDGHIVTTADGGQAGIDLFTTALASAKPFDVVITDLGMPYIDGRKVAENLRALSPAPNTNYADGLSVYLTGASFMVIPGVNSAFAFGSRGLTGDRRDRP